MTSVNMVFSWSWSVFFACNFVESRLSAIFCELIHVYSVFETAIYLSQDFLRKLRRLDSGEIVKTLVARTFWENSEMWEKSQKCEKNSKTEVSLRKFYIGGTVRWEKLKFSEKSQIWENLSVGGPQARRDENLEFEAEFEFEIFTRWWPPGQMLISSVTIFSNT